MMCMPQAVKVRDFIVSIDLWLMRRLSGVMYDTNLNSVVMYYHYLKPSVGYAFEQYFFGYNKLDFSGGWPTVVA